MTASPSETIDFLTGLLLKPDHGWSVGTVGAMMGQRAAASVLLVDGSVQSGPTRLRLQGHPFILAFEMLSSDPISWTHAIALCAPAPAQAGGRTAITHAGLDSRALDGEAQGEPVYDLGLGQGVSTTLFRPIAGSIAEMNRLQAQSWEAAQDALSHLPGVWIIDTPVARIEQVSQGEPPPIHVLTDDPTFTHAKTTPVPPGLVPCAHILPPPSLSRDEQGNAIFNRIRHDAFQAILAQYAAPGLWALKSRILDLLDAGGFEDIETDAHGKAVIRIALRQWAQLAGSPPPEQWLQRYDPAFHRAISAP